MSVRVRIGRVTERAMRSATSPATTMSTTPRPASAHHAGQTPRSSSLRPTLTRTTVASVSAKLRRHATRWVVASLAGPDRWYGGGLHAPCARVFARREHLVPGDRVPEDRGARSGRCARAPFALPGPPAGGLLLSQGPHLGLHDRGAGVPGRLPQIQGARRGDPRGLERRRRLASRFLHAGGAAVSAAGRSRSGDRARLRREIDAGVLPAHHLPGRRRGDRAPGVRSGAPARPRARGAGGGADARHRPRWRRRAVH